MLGHRVAALAIFVLGAAGARGADDPWVVPGPGGAELLLVLEKSPRSYTVLGGKSAPKEPNGPERVELKLEPEEKAQLVAARALVAKGDHDAAAKAVDALLRRNPANWDALLVRAQSLHARGSAAEAVAPLRDAIIGNRRNPDAWKLLTAVAKTLGKRVVPPKLAVKGWIRETGKDEVEVGSLFEKNADMPWTYYAAARAVYRYEGAFAKDFPDLPATTFTFREQMYAMRVLAEAAEEQRKDGKKNPPELERVLAESKAGTLAPFAFFAVYPEPIGRTPEPHLEELKPRLVEWFDTKVLVP